MTRVPLGTSLRGKEVFWDLAQQDLIWRVPDVRETIIAKPGYKILSADFSQIEIKIMAFLSQDPDLILAINSGKDLHSFIATKIYGHILNFDYDLMIKAKKDPSHPRHIELNTLRSNTKTVVFGIPYGAGPSRIAFLANMLKEDGTLDIDTAQQLMDDYLDSFSILKVWLKKVGDQALSVFYSQSAGGRKRLYTLPSIDNPEYNKIISQIRRWGSNQPIQATGSDMLKRAILLIFLRIRGNIATADPKLSGRLKLVVHDEIVMEWLESEAYIGGKIMSECMTEAYDYYVQGIMNEVSVLVENHWAHG